MRWTRGSLLRRRFALALVLVGGLALLTDGLVAALERPAETGKLAAVTCGFRCSVPELHPHPPTGLALYRITQEAIHNAITLGHARRIDIELPLNRRDVHLRITDDGAGFRVDAKQDAGMGLHSMDYRARSIGGTLKIASQVNHGAEVHCHVPCASCFPAASATAAGGGSHD